MNLEIRSFLNVIKRNYLYILFLFLIYFIKIFLQFIDGFSNFGINDICLLLVSPYNDFDFLNYSFSLFQIILLCYITFEYIVRDVHYNFNNIVLRINDRKYIFNKLLVSSLFIIFFKIISFLLIYFSFHKVVNIDINILINSIFYSLLINGLVFVISLFKHIYRVIFMILFFIFCYFSFNYFNLYLCIIFTLFIDSICILFFKFKNILYK